MSEPLNVPLARRSIVVIERLLEFASNGWFTNEVFDNDLFKTPEQEEEHIKKILKKIKEFKKKNPKINKYEF
jgi:hypothetical protein